ncbi:MAG: YkvA family protein [Candidatus Hydrothermia bacterium]
MTESRKIHHRVFDELFLLFFILKSPKTPLYVKIIAFLGLSYALSPVDLIPDFIPVLGYLDDVFILPAFYFLIKKLTPPSVIEDARQKRGELRDVRIYKIFGAIFVSIFWFLILLLFVSLVWKLIRKSKL